MKLYTLLLLSMLSMAAFAGENKPKDLLATENSSNGELVVAFEKLSSKQYSDLNTALNSISGIKHVGQCEAMNVYFFSYDTAMYRSAEDAFEAVTAKTKDYLPLMKIGSSIEQVINVCNQ